MEAWQADVTSVKVRSFQSQIFLNGLRFHQLYAYMTLFSSTSNFLSNDVGCEHILIGRCEEKESWTKEGKQKEKDGQKTSGARDDGDIHMYNDDGDIHDDGDDVGGFYLPSRNIDVHECTCNRRCRGQNRWNPPWITNTIWNINSIFHIVFVIHGGFHLFWPLRRLSHVHSWTSTFLLGK